MKTLMRLLIAVWLLGGWLPITSAAAENDLITLECQIYRIGGSLSGETSLAENFWAGKKPMDAELKKALTLFTDASLRIGKGSLEAKPDGWQLEGEQDKEIVREMSPVQVQAQPGEQAEIFVGSNQPLQYFERREDGLFELKVMHKETGLRIESRLREDPGEKAVMGDFVIRLNVVDQREQIEGVALQVGRPILKPKGLELALKLQPGRAYGLMLHPEDGKGFFIIRLRVLPNETDK